MKSFFLAERQHIKRQKQYFVCFSVFVGFQFKQNPLKTETHMLKVTTTLNVTNWY